jgi:hypothetical protein
MRADMIRRLAWTLALALPALPGTVRAQEDAPADSGAFAVRASALLEPAIYDGGARRDPFDPLTVASDETGPRFETLRLTGIFLGAPGNSLVVLEDPTRRGHFLRQGEEIAGARLIQIDPESAVFDVEEYGAVRREVLRLERSEERP